MGETGGEIRVTRDAIRIRSKKDLTGCPAIDRCQSRMAYRNCILYGANQCSKPQDKPHTANHSLIGLNEKSVTGTANRPSEGLKQPKLYAPVVRSSLPNDLKLTGFLNQFNQSITYKPCTIGTLVPAAKVLIPGKRETGIYNQALEAKACSVFSETGQLRVEGDDFGARAPLTV
ncbi:hypothetical protein T265_01695 [Opisthorchis viverrini]|uniref:Uncharacterized protein n=1 Tax=Opisthorchis viverrini TaxID=6198 RepID=A0A075A971_OPIVI|nr:hypothetical protein T265_01695 [Opisthorchis viverrini]KER32270.1 hypothetical protein T265_01695 [Opisthorchis viverrini]